MHIYYGSDMLKAKVCAEGARCMAAFAEAEGIAVNRCDKVILATAEARLSTVEKLVDNVRDNDSAAERIDAQQLKEIEPFSAPGPTAIFCPSTAAMDTYYRAYKAKAPCRPLKVTLATVS